MRVREATLADVPRLADISVAAYDGVSFFEFLFPNQHQHPKDFRLWFKSNLKEHILTPYNVVTVVEAERPNGRTAIIGYSVWLLWPRTQNAIPRTVEPKLRKDSFSEKYARKVHKWESSWASTVGSNKAPDMHAFGEWGKSFSKVVEECYSEDKYKVHWHLKYIATDPSWQRKGAGTMMLDWGHKQAERDNLPVLLEAVEESLEFYKRNGYQVLGDYKLGKTIYREVVREAPRASLSTESESSSAVAT